jgi:DNA gyrase/topoisomerase IV subunit A
MAKGKKKSVTALVKGSVVDESISSFGNRQMIIYATDVNMDRSIPDLFDGLKPVHRRILWAAANVARASGEAVKSLRIIGDTTAKYHVHGDSAVYGAMVTLVQLPYPPLFGEGNWGTLTDPAAAARYTNSKLSNYGATMFDPDYLNKEVTTFVPNYDDKDIEPVTLPVQLPNLLLNGVDTGIGVGVTTRIPSFTLPSVLAVMQALLKGKKLKPKHYAQMLELSFRWGGRMAKSKENEEAWAAMFGSETASLKYIADMKSSFDHRTVTISGWPPGLNPEKTVGRLQEMAAVDSADVVSVAHGIPVVVATMKKGYNKPQFDEWVKAVKKMCTVRNSYRINVTERTAKTEDGVTSFDTQFKSLTIPALFERWVELRIELEKRSLQYRIRKTENAIAYSKLLIYAVSVLEIIFKALKAKDTLAFLVKNTKMNEEQAKTILNMKVSSLSKLDDEKQRETLKDQQKQLAELQDWLTAPATKIRKDLKAFDGKEFWLYDPVVTES